MDGTPPVLTQERVAEINTRLSQGGWKIFFDALLGDNTKRTSEVNYVTTDERFAALQALLERIAGRCIWCVHGTQENSNPKRYGGFSPLVTKYQVRVTPLDPPFIDTNVTIWGMEFGWRGPKLLFFPDTLLMYKDKRYEIVPYESLSVGHGTMPSVESSAAHGAEVIEDTWVHTNLDGGPDRRYKDNPRLLIVLFDLVLIKSTLGLRLPLLIPDQALAARLRYHLPGDLAS